MDITISFQQIIWAAGVITALAAAYKVLAPVLKLDSRVSKLERKQTDLFDKLDTMQKDSRIADRLLVKAMVEVVDNRITGNNVENLKKTKDDLMNFLKDN